MTLLLAFLALALLVSFFCSIAEAVILSVRPAYVEALQRKKPSAAKALERLQANLDRPLAAILTLNTVAHTVGAAGVGAQAAVVFGNERLGAKVRGTHQLGRLALNVGRQRSARLTSPLLGLREIVP